MAKCLFSVVIPLYNMADTIKRTINSVLNQTCQDFEIVVVDDGSKDDGASIARAINDDRITVIQQLNGGVSAARNNGIEHAKGQFITFLDADDEYMTEHLETLKLLIDIYPNYNVYATSYKLIKGSIPSIKNLRFKDYQKSCRGGVIVSYFHTVASRGNPVLICTIAIRRIALGDIRFPLGVRSGEDLYFMARLMIDNKMVLSTKPTFIYHNSVTAKRPPAGTHEKQDECFDSLLKLDCKDKYLRHYVALWHTRRATGGLRKKQPKTIIFHLWRSLQILPFQTKIFTAMLSALIHR